MSQQNFDPNQYGQQPAQGMPQPVLGQAVDAQGKATLAAYIRFSHLDRHAYYVVDL